MITANEARAAALNSVTFRELKKDVNALIERASRLHRWSCNFGLTVPKCNEILNNNEMISKIVCALIVELKCNGFEIIKRPNHKSYNDNGDYIACDIQIKW